MRDGFTHATCHWSHTSPLVQSLTHGLPQTSQWMNLEMFRGNPKNSLSKKNKSK